jgi:hypothetical protein
MAWIARNGCPVGTRASQLTSENKLAVRTSEPRIIISSIQKPEKWNHRSRHSERLCPQPAKAFPHHQPKDAFQSRLVRGKSTDTSHATVVQSEIQQSASTAKSRRCRSP